MGDILWHKRWERSSQCLPFSQQSESENHDTHSETEHLDVRLGFACASGAACTYATKMRYGTGIELAEIIPGFAQRFDVQDLVKCIAPRKTLLVSATEDQYARDAEVIVQMARETFVALGAECNLAHRQYRGGHALTPERFEDIIAWIVTVCRE
jgi:hypothetical protein